MPSVLWDISSCSLHNTLGLINIHKRACPQKCSKLTSFTGKHTDLHLHHPQTIYRWKSPDLHPHLERRTEYHAFSHICGVIANIQSMTRKMKVSTQIGSSAASFWSTTFVPAISPPVSALAEFASSSHPLVMLQWYWWDFWRSLWAFSFLPHHPLCSAPLKDQSQRLISPFMKDLTFVYLTPQPFINSVCFN